MRISLVYCAMLLVALLVTGFARRAWLLPVWVVSFMVFPTLKVEIGEAPIYLYDMVTVVLLAAFAAGGEMSRWPKGVPRWHLWFAGVAFFLSVLAGSLRYGFIPDILWIWGHSALAWVAFALGVVALAAERRAIYQEGLQQGFGLSAVILMVVTCIQYADLPGSEFIANLFYRDTGKAEMLENLRQAAEIKRAFGPHMASTTMSGMALLCGMAYWLVSTEADRIKRGLVTLACTVALLCTVSRHAMLAGFLGGGVLFLLSEVRTKFKVVVSVTIIGLLVFASGYGMLARKNWMQRFASMEQGILEDDNIAARVVLGPARLFEYLTKNPGALLTGAGLEPEKLASKSKLDENFESGFVSNGFLLSLYYLGVGGLLLYLGFWGWTVWMAVRHPPALRARICGFVTTAMILVAADNYSFMYEPAVATLFLIVGLIAGAQHRGLEEENLVVHPAPSEETYAA